MSKISIEGNASGSGTITIAAPNTNSNATLTLPTASGTVVTTAGAQTIEFAAGTAGAPSITFTGDTNTGIFSPAADTIAFSEGGAEAMRISDAGNVGIGTSSPETIFEVSGSNANNFEAAFLTNTNTTTSTPSTGLTFRLSQSGGSIKKAAIISAFKDNTWGSNASTDAGIAFSVIKANSLAERARITSGGEFLVGTTTSQGVKFAADGGAGSAIWGKCSTVSAAVNITWNSATSGDNLFEQFFVGTGPSLVGSIDYNRTGGLTRYNTTSDATLKKIIGDSNGQKSVEILNSTRIREFAWKDDETQKPQIGVIAQELYETYKGAVSVGGDYEVTIPAVTEQRLVSEAVLDEDGNEIEAAVYETVEVEPERTETKYRPWGVDKTAFTFHLVAGWQAHEKIIKQQADMIAALEARIAALEQA